MDYQSDSSELMSAEATATRLEIDLNKVECIKTSSSGRLFKPLDGRNPASKEVSFADKIALLQGSDFIFPKTKNQSGIDGFYRSNGCPVQLKTLEGTPKNQPSKVVTRANEAYDSAKNNGWTDIDLHIEALGTTTQEVVMRWNQPNRVPTPKDMSGGFIKRIRVHCSDGIVELPLPSSSNPSVFSDISHNGE